MTIEVVYEVDCDGCGFCTQHSDFETKRSLWSWLKERGWRRRGQYLWCSDCVEQGVFRANYICWMETT